MFLGTMKRTAFQRTGQECPICEEGELLEGDYERFCDTCYTVIEKDAFVGKNKTAIELWHDHRNENYDGLYGPERVKMAGGFTYPSDL